METREKRGNDGRSHIQIMKLGRVLTTFPFNARTCPFRRAFLVFHASRGGGGSFDFFSQAPPILFFSLFFHPKATQRCIARRPAGHNVKRRWAVCLLRQRANRNNASAVLCGCIVHSTNPQPTSTFTPTNNTNTTDYYR